MKNLFLFFLLVLSSNIGFGQTAYIQVNGEAGLSVFLNNQFKGKTTVELKGLIIENVTPGKNLIKVAKEGYTPFEEYITVKPGEVFSYNVKPFTKHMVSVSQEGNAGETEGKMKVETGKLIVQSVPIEISITIPDIEGIVNNQKTKDKWVAEDIPAGNYTITFTYGQKIITKNIQIEKDSITSVFINMLSGELVVKFKEKLPYESREETMAYINQLLSDQDAVNYGEYYGSGNSTMQNKINQRTYSYRSNALTYSKEKKSYALALTGSFLTWGISNGMPYEITSPVNYSEESTLKGTMIFEEPACGTKPLITGSCNCLLICTDTDISTPQRECIRIYLPGKDPKVILALKKAFLHLNELGFE